MQLIFFLYSWDGMRLSPLDTEATSGLTGLTLQMHSLE
jgi:hypothetical protein